MNSRPDSSDAHPDAPNAEAGTTVLEQSQRLSRSLLWDLMHAFYDSSGLEAWRGLDPVPHHVTNSAFLADTYARLIEGYVVDAVAAGTADANHPLYILELGAGHGRLGYRLVKRLMRERASPLADRPWVYVLTDLSEANVAAWRAHPWFQPLIEAGHLDFARLDIGRDREVRLQVSGVVLAAGTVDNPLVVIANYLFDSLPQDAFCVQDGQLFERLITLTTHQAEPDHADPSIVARAVATYSSRPTTPNYYAEPTWNRILEAYHQNVDDAVVLFPTTALTCLGVLEEMSRGHLLLLSSDNGTVRPGQFLPASEAPGVAIHASHAFSMIVNYHALGEYVGQKGGLALLPSGDPHSLSVCAFVLGQDESRVAYTRRAYAETVDAFGPDEFYTLEGAIEERKATLSLSEILAFLRLARSDELFLGRCLPEMERHLNAITLGQRDQVRALIRDAWDGYLPIGENKDRPTQLGAFLFQLGFVEDAVELVQASAAVYGWHPGNLWNAALCYQELGDHARAAKALQDALEIAPDFGAASELLQVLQQSSD